MNELSEDKEKVETKMKTMTTIQIDQTAMNISEGKISGFELDMAWADLYMAVKGEVLGSVKKKFAGVKGYNFEQEILEESVDHALMVAVKDYDINKGKFVPRVMDIAVKTSINAIKKAHTKKQIAHTHAMSSNVKINGTDGEVGEYQDLFVDETANTFHQAFGKRAIEDVMMEKLPALFSSYKEGKKKNKEMAEVLEVYMAHTVDFNRKIALLNHFGFADSTTEWNRARKRVERAKKHFQKYLATMGVEL